MRFLRTLSCLAPLFLLATSVRALEPVWQITEGLDHPESAYIDPVSGHLFLSQVIGSGQEKDGKGVISKLTVDGKMLDADWITGLNAPKGLRSHGNRLWVSDLDRIVGVDIKQGKIAEVVEVPGAKFLNDLATGPDGAVYVADMIGSKVYRYKDKKLSVFIEGKEIESPNGLLVHDGKLVVGAWGYTTDFTTETPGRLYSVDLKSKKKTLITPKPTGNLDGVEVDGKGGYVVTDWPAGKVLSISGKGEVNVLMTLPKGAADHAYIPSKQLLILPQMLENKLTAFDLSKQ